MFRLSRSRLTGRTVAAVAALALAYGVGTVTAGGPVQADSGTSSADTVTVAGLGMVGATPDQLRLDVRVVQVRPDASAALDAVSTVTGRVRTALRQHGVASEDLSTSQLSIDARYDRKGQTVTGFQVTQGLSATLRDLAQAGSTITDVVKAGGNAVRVDGVAFQVSNPDAVKVRARNAAFEQARKQAEQYATLAGRSLGAVQSVQEDVGGDSFQPQLTFAKAAASSAVQLDPGTQQVQVRAVVRWALQ